MDVDNDVADMLRLRWAFNELMLVLIVAAIVEAPVKMIVSRADLMASGLAKTIGSEQIVVKRDLAVALIRAANSRQFLRPDGRLHLYLGFGPKVFANQPENLYNGPCEGFVSRPDLIFWSYTWPLPASTPTSIR
jgi:hypothetical protein